MRRLDWLLFAALAAAAVGVVAAGVDAWVEVQRQQYLALDLPYNAFRTLADAITRGAREGLLAGVVLYGVFAALRLVRRRHGRSSDATALMPYLMCVAVTLLAIGGSAWADGRIGARRTWALIAVAGLWCVLYAVSRARTVARGRRWARLARTGLYLIPLLVGASAFWVRSASELMRPGTLAAAVLVGAVGWFGVERLPVDLTGTVRRPPWILTLPAVLALLVPVSAPLLVDPGLSLQRPRHVILIGVDTLRADRTSLPGEGRRDTSPHLAALAARGTYFGNAISQAPWTMPAFASVLTGRYPRQHGAVSLNGYLRPREVTLAEWLREAGYDTAGIVSHVYVDGAHGFDQGFDTYDESNVRGFLDVTSRDITDRALRFLAGRHDDPFFLFLHYFDPHYEYRDQPDFDYAASYRGWLKNGRPDVSALRDRRHDLAEADIAYLQDLYDEDVAFTDAQIGRLLTFLRHSGLDETTIVIVVADHGEEFMERGWLGHTTSLHEELIRVPLIVALPRGTVQQAVVARPVETRAIVATVLDALQSDRPGELSRGSLLPLIRGESGKGDAALAFSEVWLPDAGVDKRLRMSSVRTERFKFVQDLTRGREQLYDLIDDPNERMSLLESRPEAARELRGLLESWRLELGGFDLEVPTADLTEEQQRRLRSLGYIK